MPPDDILGLLLLEIDGPAHRRGLCRRCGTEAAPQRCPLARLLVSLIEWEV